VARNNLVPLAPREAAAELAVERAQLRSEALGLGATVELFADARRDRRVTTGSSQT
jgi:hypothetical protein